MRILLLEDEESIRGFIRINLKRNEMEVIEAETGEAALELASEKGPVDIALLDVMLPTISGFEVCAKLRETYPQMGIIMLTAKSQEEDKIHGLELGADDYVQKPFSPGELIARIKSLYRRMGARLDTDVNDPSDVQPNDADSKRAEAKHAGAVEDRLAGGGGGPDPLAVAASSGPDYAAAGNAQGTGAAGFAEAGERRAANEGSREVLASGTMAENGGKQQPEQGYRPSLAVDSYELHVPPFRLSIPERKLWKERQEIILTPTEWTLVRLLMERVGQSVSRDHILSEVWGRYYVGDLKVVDVNIRRIRQKIEKNPSDPAFVETVWGYGYRWKRAVDK